MARDNSPFNNASLKYCSAPFLCFAGLPLASIASRPATETQGPTARFKTRSEAGNKAQLLGFARGANSGGSSSPLLDDATAAAELLKVGASGAWVLTSPDGAADPPCLNFPLPCPITRWHHQVYEENVPLKPRKYPESHRRWRRKSARSESALAFFPRHFATRRRRIFDECLNRQPRRTDERAARQK
jgi:hypothetical protein